MGKIEDMKEKANLEQEQIELRSEKVRNIIGEMPSFLIRWGNTILLVVFLMLSIFAWIMFSKIVFDR